jgi:hypothetical protein
LIFERICGGSREFLNGGEPAIDPSFCDIPAPFDLSVSFT